MEIVRTKNFILSSRDKNPHISRADGGHLVIDPINNVEDRTCLSVEQGKELVVLSMIAGEAMKKGLQKTGINLWRINYQDNGNWRPELHIHLYGRSEQAIIQKKGHALKFPVTKDAFIDEMPGLDPLNETDISNIKKEFKKLLDTDKYSFFKAYCK